jgi:thioredoxin-related protein
MNSLETFFLSCDFSWVASRLFPYALFLLIGLLCSLLVVWRFKFIGHIRILFLISLPLVFVSFYFSFYPIYQGDFANDQSVFQRNRSMLELKENRLIVLSLPGCPYCLESMERMRMVKQRHPEITIEYKVCHGDSSAIRWFKNKGKNDFDYSLASDVKMTSKLAQGLYPTYVMTNQSILRVWSVEQFGMAALDEVEEILNKK